MGCAFCGGGGRWTKTCLAADGSRVPICGTCYGPRAHELTIVPGDAVVTARCDRCGHYGHPREFAGVSLGGRKGAYSGTCAACVAGEEGPRLTPGYRLDRRDPDVWALRRPEGWVVAHFSARGATREAVERVAWEDHEVKGEEQYP